MKELLMFWILLRIMMPGGEPPITDGPAVIGEGGPELSSTPLLDALNELPPGHPDRALLELR